MFLCCMAMTLIGICKAWLEWMVKAGTLTTKKTYLVEHLNCQWMEGFGANGISTIVTQWSTWT